MNELTPQHIPDLAAAADDYIEPALLGEIANHDGTMASTAELGLVSLDPLFDNLLELGDGIRRDLRRAQAVDWLTAGPLRRLPGMVRDIANAYRDNI